MGSEVGFQGNKLHSQLEDNTIGNFSCCILLLFVISTGLAVLSPSPLIMLPLMQIPFSQARWEYWSGGWTHTHTQPLRHEFCVYCIILHVFY